jgi:hypothetical protein
MKRITYLFIVQFLITSSVVAQSDTTKFISLSVGENRRTLVLFHNNGTVDTISEYPGGATLIDFLVETADSVSFVLLFSDVYIFSKMEKRYDGWKSTIKKSWGVRPLDKSSINQPVKDYKVRIINYATLEITREGIKTTIQLPEKER